MDCAGLKPWDINVNLFYDLMFIGIEYFATTGKYTYLVNLPWLLQKIYQMIYFLVPEFTRNNVVVVDEK